MCIQTPPSSLGLPAHQNAFLLLCSAPLPDGPVQRRLTSHRLQHRCVDTAACIGIVYLTLIQSRFVAHSCLHSANASGLDWPKEGLGLPMAPRWEKRMSCASVYKQEKGQGRHPMKQCPFEVLFPPPQQYRVFFTEFQYLL